MRRLLPFQKENHHPVVFVAMNVVLFIAFFSFGISTINAAITFPSINARERIRRHILEEVQTSVNAQRTAAGISQRTFTALPSGFFKKISAQNLQEARTAISEIYTNKGLPAPTWTDPVLTPGQTIVKAVHFTELKAKLEAPELLGGTITTIAGSGNSWPSQTLSGDNDFATNAKLSLPSGVVVDSIGNVYIADTNNSRIRKIDAVTKRISTIAGSGTRPSTSGAFLILGKGGFSGDGGLAINAMLSGPRGVTIDQVGNIYIVDSGNHRIRKINAVTKKISTIAGKGPLPLSGGSGGFSGDNGLATNAGLNSPADLAIGQSGIYIADAANCRIRKFIEGGNITTIAGTGCGFSGDGDLAINAKLNSPVRIALDQSENIYIADYRNHRIRKIDAVTKKISTIAGSGAITPSSMGGFSGDGGLATEAQLSSPYGIFLDQVGNIYFTDHWNYRIRKIDAVTKKISTIAGSEPNVPSGGGGFSGDGGPAIAARMSRSEGIAIDQSGNIYIADSYNNRIRKISF